MFGFVVANGEALSEAQLQRYRGCYCGLCRCLNERHGCFGRLTLNYDMTFLVLLLSSMYEPEEKSGEARCFMHPVHRREYWRNRFTEYAADMTVALAYHNCMDDWNDDRKLFSYAEASLLRRHYAEIKSHYGAQCEAIEDCMACLAEIEKSAEISPDDAANCFGRLMGELFAVEEDTQWQPHFRRFGECLGRFIYMMDACVDFEKDRKRARFNPLNAMAGEDLTDERKTAILKLLIGECAAEFEKLPLLQDVDILRNILYSGVWSRYAAAIKRREKDT